MSVLDVSVYIHIIGLALNRLHAVLFPFSYQHIWKERNIKYILLIIWLISLVWGGIVYVGFNIISFSKGFLRIFTIGIITAGDLPAFTAIFLATPSYAAVLAKFIYDYKNNKMQTVDEKTRKERIRILIVCLVSLIPCPWYIVVNKYREDNINNTDNTFYILTTSLYTTSYTILKCIEEICLLIISKDFRKLVKSQFVKNSQNNIVATTIFVSQSPHKSRMIQLNGRHNT
ncbi:hypothetical protein ACQ4LE_001696 [Meloidogyne hapla]